jgi:hypothetical protein
VRENNKGIKTRLVQYAIRSLPIALAVRLTCSIAAKTKPAPVSDEEQAIMARTTRIGFGPNGSSSAWSWGAGQPSYWSTGGAAAPHKWRRWSRLLLEKFSKQLR